MPPSPFASTGTATAVPVTPDTHPLPEALAPKASERLHRLCGDLRAGLPVILQDGSESTLVALVEGLTETRYSAMTALGQPELALTRRRAEALGARVPILADTVHLRVPRGAGLDWLSSVSGEAHPGSAAAKPLPILQAGTSLHRSAIAIAKAIEAMPAVIAVPLIGRDAAAIGALGLSAMPLALVGEALAEARSQTRVSSARLPMDASAAGRVHVFRTDDGGAEHYAIEIGTPDLSGPVTVRLHSACFTGDVLGSLKCDCGPQLRAAMAAMGAGAGGVLLYLNQEGRGIGLANKMRAYALQDTGMDTVEANHWLGFEDDQRDFRVGAQILRRMGIAQVRLMTNNPAKTASLAAQGIAVVERVPLQVGRTTQNARYLATKAAKSGHLL